MKRTWFFGILIIGLSACGFQPRGSHALPDAIGPIQVVNLDTYSVLTDELQSAVARASAKSANGNAATPAKLTIYSETWETKPLAIDDNAQVLEYFTRYSVKFDLLAADGTILLEEQKLELSRQYAYDNSVAAGNPAEQEVIRRELRRDMQAAIIRRIDIVLRQKK